jgi:hypothetical protein
MAESSVGCGQRSFNRLNKAASTLAGLIVYGSANL